MEARVVAEPKMSAKGGRTRKPFFRAARGVWVAEVKRPDGRTVTRTAKTEAAAAKLLIELQADVLGGVRRAGRDLTVGDWIQQWMRLPSDIEPKSQMTYFGLMRNHWLAHPIATIPLKSLRARHVQTALDELGPATTGRKLSRTTKQHLRAVMSNAMSSAVARGVLDSNPVSAVKFRQGQPQRARQQDVSKERWKRIHEAVKDSPFRALYHLMMDGSLRMGEALALTWDDVHLGKPTEGRRPWVFVRAAIKERTRADGRGIEQYRGKPKTDQSVRKIFLNDETIIFFHQLRGQQGKTPGLVFRSVNDPTREPNKGTISRDFRACMAAAGLKDITARDLRHWAPTIMLSEGVALPAVSKRLGHAQISTTVNRYSHVVLKDEERAADALEIWGRKKRGKSQ
jgi:integrase